VTVHIIRNDGSYTTVSIVLCLGQYMYNYITYVMVIFTCIDYVYWSRLTIELFSLYI